MLTDQLDLYQRLHEIRHQSLEILLNTREQTASALIADNVYELDIFDESSDAKQVVQLVSDQVGLAKHKLRQLESDRRKLLQQIEQGQQQAASILRELQHAHTQDEEVNHVSTLYSYLNLCISVDGKWILGYSNARQLID